MAIDIGATASDRGVRAGSGNTTIGLDNPANASGYIDVFEIWFDSFYANGAGVKAGTFSGAGTDYTSRDVETIGDVTKGSKQTFSGLHCDVVTGDFAGIYWTAGELEADSSGGAGIYQKAGDQFGQGQQTYGGAAGYVVSLHGTGISMVAPTVTTQGVDNIGFD